MDLKTLLIVDSIELNRCALGAMLSSRYRIVEAPDGASALDILFGEPGCIDIALIAFALDDKDGLEVLQAMRDNEALACMPVVMLSLEPACGLMQRAYELGASDYICRPYDVEVIQHRLENALALSRGASLQPQADASPCALGDEELKAEMEELSHRNALIEARILQARSIFDRLTDESWFEYNFDPATLIASKRFCELFGVAPYVDDPLSNGALPPLVRELITRMLDHHASLEPGETCFETLVDHEGPSGKHRYVVKAGIAPLPGELNSLSYGIVGQVCDIEDKVSSLEQAASDTTRKVALALDGIDVCATSLEELNTVVSSLFTVFDIVRLVEPSICAEIKLEDECIEVQRHCNCFDVWGKGERCANCISMRVNADEPRLNKFESIGSDIYYIISNYLVLGGVPYALECVSKVDEVPSDLPDSACDRHLVSLANTNRKLYEDAVSGARSRAFYNDRSSKLTGSYAVAVVDIDNFKAINDDLGHVWGDKALHFLVEALSTCVRSVDRVIRYGGDEFVVVLVDMEPSALEAKLDAMLAAANSVRIGDAGEVGLAISIGAVCGYGNVGEMFTVADAALLEAKKRKGCYVVGEWDR